MTPSSVCARIVAAVAQDNQRLSVVCAEREMIERAVEAVVRALMPSVGRADIAASKRFRSAVNVSEGGRPSQTLSLKFKVKNSSSG